MAGSFTICSCSAAQADERTSFREFRSSHSGSELSNRELRQLYRNEFGSTERSNQSAAERAISRLNAASTSSLTSVDRQVPTVQRRSIQIQASGKALNTRNGVDLHLESETRNIVLGGKLFERVDSVSIERDGQPVKLSAGSQVTAAEYIAVKQVLMNGTQSIALDETGRATGGSLDLSQITAKNDRMRADDLSVPVNVTAYGDFAKGSTFQLLGDLDNAGTVFVHSSRRSGSSGVISADNIRNEANGLITAEVDLVLKAEHSISNLGTISGSTNIELNASTIVNHGSVSSETGSITLSANEALTIDNRGGTLKAMNGAVNLRDRSFNEEFATYIVGGDLISKEVNVFTGQGTADIYVDELTGTLNQKGLASHVFAKTEVLTLGKICLDGDPTYQNSTGSIVINGNITVGEALTLIADADITNSIPVVVTAGSSAQGFNITLIAGADITSGTPDITVIGPIPPAVPGTPTTISGMAGTGGNVLLGVNELSPVTINARPTSGNNNNGGNVLVAAFDNAGAGGRIDMSFATINSGGRGSGTNGDVTLIAGGTAVNGFTMIVGAIDASGGSGGGGDVQISGFRPVSSGGPITYDQFGVRTSAAQIVTSTTSALGSNILFRGDTKAAGDVTITAGQDANINLADASITTEGTTGTVDITALGLGNITSSAFSTVSTFTINLTVAQGDIGDIPNFTPIFTDAQFINLNGDAVATDVLLQTFNPGLNIISGTAFSMNIATQGTVITNPDSGPITADTLLIGSFSGSAGLNETLPLEVDTTFLFVAGLGGNVFVHNNNTGQTNLTGGQALQAAGTLSITSDGTMGLADVERIQAKNVILKPASEFLNLNGTINGSTSVSLIADLAIDPDNIGASINTPLLKVTSLSSNVGTDILNAFQPGSGVGAVAAFAPSGDVFLQGAAASKAGLAGGFANGVFDYRGTGSTNVSGDITTSGATGDINIIINGAGTLTVNQNVTLNASQNLNLLITDPSTKQKIAIGKNAALQTNNGNILISVGTPSGPVAGTPPAKGVGFVAVNGGQIFWGDFGVTGKGVNAVMAVGADIQFTNTIKSNAITLGGGAAIVGNQ